MLACSVILITILSTVFGLPDTIGIPKIKQPDVGVQLPPQDWWKWRNNPLYGDYWQRDPLRRTWTPRPQSNYAYTHGPDTQYTYQIYDTPEYFGYDSNYPGGRTHFIGYRSQGQIRDELNKTGKDGANTIP